MDEGATHGGQGLCLAVWYRTDWSLPSRGIFLRTWTIDLFDPFWGEDGVAVKRGLSCIDVLVSSPAQPRIADAPAMTRSSLRQTRTGKKAMGLEEKKHKDT